MKYWLEDVRGKHYIFEAKDDKDAVIKYEKIHYSI